jgi:site-specific DNA-methyltransferase (adenine-specific)
MNNELGFEEVSRDCLIVNEDSLKILERMQPNSIDLILTDPPYNIGKFMQDRNTNMGKLRKNHFSAASWDDLDYPDWFNNMDLFFKNASNVLKIGGSLIIFMSLIKIETIIKLAEKYGFYYKTTGIWHKKNPMPRNMNLHFVNSTEAWIYFIYKKKRGTFNNQGKVVHDFFETGLTPKNEKDCGDHPTQKPEKLVENFVTLLTNKGDLILDPFMGSGTTGKVCQSFGRKFIGIEISPKYYKIAKKRLSSCQTSLQSHL